MSYAISPSLLTYFTHCDTESLVDQALIETILVVQWRRGLKGK